MQTLQKEKQKNNPEKFEKLFLENVDQEFEALISSKKQPLKLNDSAPVLS